MWSKFDDQFYLNPKSAMMDRDEQDLYFAGIIYCNGQLTDGFIPVGVLVMLCTWAKIPLDANPQAIAQAIASHLVEHNFWHSVEGGYQVHDFLEWNASKEEVTALKNARSEAGRRGGQKSSAQKTQSEALAQASAQAKSKQNSTQSPSQSQSQSQNTKPPEDVDIFSLYQNNIGMLTPMISEELKDAEATYSAEWIKEAIAESVKNNARSWKYASAILQRWSREGFQSNTKKNGSQPKTKAAAEVWQ
jgi:DnaD/phage-associated family protein